MIFRFYDIKKEDKIELSATLNMSVENFKTIRIKGAPNKFVYIIKLFLFPG